MLLSIRQMLPNDHPWPYSRAFAVNLLHPVNPEIPVYLPLFVVTLSGL